MQGHPPDGEVVALVWEVGGGGDGPADESERVLFLPRTASEISGSAFFTRPTLSPPPPPENIPPIEEKLERGIVLALIGELNAPYGVKLDPAPALVHGVVTLEKNTVQENNSNLWVTH